MRTRLGLTAGAALLWLTAAPAFPQGSGFTERIDVELVNVDVWVSDSKGNPVAGLEARDFEILHDDQKVPRDGHRRARRSDPRGFVHFDHTAGRPRGLTRSLEP